MLRDFVVFHDMVTWKLRVNNHNMSRDTHLDHFWYLQINPVGPVLIPRICSSCCFFEMKSCVGSQMCTLEVVTVTHLLLLWIGRFRLCFYRAHFFYVFFNASLFQFHFAIWSVNMAWIILLMWFINKIKYTYNPLDLLGK